MEKEKEEERDQSFIYQFLKNKYYIVSFLTTIMLIYKYGNISENEKVMLCGVIGWDTVPPKVNSLIITTNYYKVKLK